MAGLVLEDGRRWGDAAEPWQWTDAQSVLDRDGPPYQFLTRGRGGSKTGDLGGMSIAAMLTQAPPGARAYCLAADRDQGRLFVDSVRGFVARTPELQNALHVDAYRVSTVRGDVVLEVLAADSAGAWGPRPWWLVVDEVANWAIDAGSAAALRGGLLGGGEAGGRADDLADERGRPRSLEREGARACGGVAVVAGERDPGPGAVARAGSAGGAAASAAGVVVRAAVPEPVDGG